MGTNYYLRINPCPHCKMSQQKPLHIGKLSAGWRFGLHVEDWDDFPKSLAEWQELWKTGEIYDEYGAPVTDAAMLETITAGTRGMSRVDSGSHVSMKTRTLDGYDLVWGYFR